VTTRRLAAILAADVVGFSSMMERNEEGTLARLKALQRDLFEPRVSAHHGRVVKTTGDGFLVVFASPLEAVRRALGVQEELVRNGSPEAPEGPLRLRIRITLGDIIIQEDGDIGAELRASPDFGRRPLEKHPARPLSRLYGRALHSHSKPYRGSAREPRECASAARPTRLAAERRC
jgi:hypothetical protein